MYIICKLVIMTQLFEYPYHFAFLKFKRELQTKNYGFAKDYYMNRNRIVLDFYSIFKIENDEVMTFLR